jgi:hypothetical protein
MVLLKGAEVHRRGRPGPGSPLKNGGPRGSSLTRGAAEDAARWAGFAVDVCASQVRPLKHKTQHAIES